MLSVIISLKQGLPMHDQHVSLEALHPTFSPFDVDFEEVLLQLQMELFDLQCSC